LWLRKGFPHLKNAVFEHLLSKKQREGYSYPESEDSGEHGQIYQPFNLGGSEGFLTGTK
jgi:hypothetical protein